ncbi:MAG: valine--pyruvate transaminase [Gammaproteobacteria bacterium]|nr:valine--pyruvate transaminase [Gammaproteobacteria bacterium]
MEFSKFAKKFTEHSGINQLMEDLGEAMAGDNDMLMLGGGNPAHIPEVQAFFQDRMQRIAAKPAEFAHIIGNYDPPKGDKQFIRALVDLIRDQYGWDVGPDNIALTAGSQAGFFLLFNILAGEFENGLRKQILLPMSPEYIGYAELGLTDDLFVANIPEIETFEDRTFKYHVNFEQLKVDESIGAICVSRPSNPTGNVISDDELQSLSKLAADNNIPLIVDNAYGMPFPNIIFTEAQLFWDSNTILCMSLSKLGLPGMRSGIVIANETIIDAIAKFNGIINLALGSFGPALAHDLVTSGEIISLSNNVIRPYYQRKAETAMSLLKRELDGVDFFIHKAEGALFLWLWLPGLSISSEALYARLKKRGVLVLSGHYFFPGLQEEWRHKDECLRITYSMNDDVVSAGIKLIAEEVKAVMNI